MKIGVISDTHGSLAAIKRAVKAAGAVDLWLHAGDCSQDAEYLKELGGVTVIAAKGNCDGRTSTKPDEFLEVGGHTIWLTHGHRYHVKQGLHELRYWAKHYEAQIVIYGHTHVPRVAKEEGIILFNPGSVAHPAEGITPTCGIMVVDGLNITARHVEIPL